MTADTYTTLMRELIRAKEKHPTFSIKDGIVALMEEVGEVAREINDHADGVTREGEYVENIATECAHVAVVAIRMLEEVEKWRNNGTR